MIKDKDISDLLCEYQEEGIINHINFVGSNHDNWRFTFRYKGKKDYLFSFEKGYVEDNDDHEYYIGFYNYDSENDNVGACVGAEYIESDKQPQIGKSFSKRINLIENIDKLIKRFQLEHVFRS